MTTTKTYGDWHDLSEAVPARGVTEPIEVEYDEGTRMMRYPGFARTFEASDIGNGFTTGPASAPQAVRWRTVREHRPDANGWFRRGEGDVAAHKDVLLRFEDGVIIGVRFKDGSLDRHCARNYLAGDRGKDVTHWKPYVPPEGVE